MPIAVGNIAAFLRQRLSALALAGFEVINHGRFWVITEGREEPLVGKHCIKEGARAFTLASALSSGWWTQVAGERRRREVDVALKASLRRLSDKEAALGLTKQQRELREGMRAIDEFIEQRNGKEDAKRRCEIYDVILKDAPDKNFVTLACGLAEPDWDEQTGKDDRKSTRTKIGAYFGERLQVALKEPHDGGRIGELEALLARTLRYGSLVGSAQNVCRHLVRECSKIDRSKAREHLVTLRSLG